MTDLFCVIFIFNSALRNNWTFVCFNYFENFMYKISISRYWGIQLGGTTLIDSVLFFNSDEATLIFLKDCFVNWHNSLILWEDIDLLY